MTQQDWVYIVNALIVCIEQTSGSANKNYRKALADLQALLKAMGVRL